MKQRPFHWAALVVALGVLSCPAAVRAASDIFLSLGGVEGESTDAVHAKWMDIQSFQWGLTGPGGTNTTRLSSLVLTKRVDAASPLLHAACASGKHFAKATLDLVRPGQRRVRYYRIVLENVIVSSDTVNHADGGAGSTAMEALGLSYARMSWVYTEFAPDGRTAGELTAYWDLLSGTGEATTKGATVVSGAPSPGGAGMNLAFPASGGITYRVMGSPDPFGPYVEVSRFTVDTTGPAATTLPTGGVRQFFYLEELP